MIEAMLDQLGEFQAQADLLEIKKRELLDAVKIPDEVIAAQEAANKQRQALDARLMTIQRELSERSRAEMEAVPMPELPIEYQHALDEAKRKRAEIQAEIQNESEAANLQANDTRAKIEADLRANTEAIYAQVATRKAEIATEFDDKASGVLDNIAKLTAEIKHAVKAEQKTVKGKFYQAVYVKGRVTWITDMLDGMIVAFPALAKARKEGEPSVTLRRI